MPKFDISCFVAELDDDEEVIDDGYDGQLNFTLTVEKGQSPERVLMDKLRELNTSDFCT